MRDFYVRVLGFRESGADGDRVRFDVEGVELVIQADPAFGDMEFRDFINQLKGNMRGTGSALHFDVDDLDRFFAAVRAAGIVALDPEKNLRLEAPVEVDGRREFAVEDPEGYWLYFGADVARVQTILFVCEGNRFRSQMAEGMFNAWAPAGWRAVSAGTTPRDSVHPKAVDLMRESGIDLTGRRPKALDLDVARRAWRVVAMCSIDACPVEVTEKTERWNIPDPGDVPEERWREIRDLIAERVKGLVRMIEQVDGLTP